jgi:peroxiredoxin
LKTTDRLTATYETVTEYAAAYKDTRETGMVTLDRSGRLRIDTDRHRRVRAGSPWEATNNGSVTVTDGKTAWQLTRHPESAQYRTQAATPEWLEKALDPLPPLQGFFGSAAKPEAARYLGPKKRDGDSFEAVAVETDRETRTVYVDASGAVRVVEIAPRNVIDGNKPVGRRDAFTRRTIRVGAWSPLSDADAAKRFAFVPPADATPVEARRSADGLLAVGAVAPDFVAEDASGKPVRLSDFAGKVVVLKFWATWCWSCRQSMPQTQQLAKEYGDKNVVVLAVAMWDSQKAFRNWTARYAKAHPPIATPALRFAYDPQPQGKDAASTLYGASATPTEFVIGRDGRVTAAFAGYDGPSEREKVAVQAALALPVAGASATGTTSR